MDSQTLGKRKADEPVTLEDLDNYIEINDKNID